MACLDNLIGITASDSITPDSGRYLNELPYISIEVADATINSETLSGRALLSSKITQAQNEMVHEFRAHLMPRMRLNSLLENDRVGEYPRVRELISPTSGQMKGVRFMLDYSQYLSLYINSVTLWLDGAESVTLYLYDLLTGEQLDSYSITTVANEPTTVQVSKAYATSHQRSRLALVCETTASAYRTNVYRGFQGCRDCRSDIGNKYIRFQGVQLPTANDKIESNIVSTSDTFGLSVDYSLNCSAEPFICNMKGLMAQPLMYKAAELVLREVKVSDRLNSIVLLHDEDVNHLIDYYHNQYIKAMTGILDTMQLPNDVCFHCNSRVKYATRIP